MDFPGRPRRASLVTAAVAAATTLSAVTGGTIALAAYTAITTDNATSGAVTDGMVAAANDSLSGSLVGKRPKPRTKSTTDTTTSTAPVETTPTTGQGYYVDCATGSDSNPGSAAEPFRTVTKATSLTLTAGQTIWLARGCTWDGAVTLRGSGTATAPVTLAAYGTGAAPTLTGSGLVSDPILRLSDEYQTVTGIHISDTHKSGIDLAAPYGTVENVEIDNVGVGILFLAPHGVARGVAAHDLHMVVNTVGGNDDYGAYGFGIQSTDAEVAFSSCVNCRAASYDYGYDGGFVEIWNYGDRLYVHDNVGDNTNGVFEVGGTAEDASARDILITANTFQSPHGGVWIHGSGTFAMAVSNVVFSNNTITGATNDDTELLGGMLTGLAFNGNRIATTGQVSWSGAPAEHTCNAYAVTWNGAVGYPLDSTENMTVDANPVTPTSAACA